MPVSVRRSQARGSVARTAQQTASRWRCKASRGGPTSTTIVIQKPAVPVWFDCLGCPSIRFDSIRTGCGVVWCGARRGLPAAAGCRRASSSGRRASSSHDVDTRGIHQHHTKVHPTTLHPPPPSIHPNPHHNPQEGGEERAGKRERACGQQGAGGSSSSSSSMTGYRKLGRTSAHRWAMLRNMVTSLIEHERIRTTTPKVIIRGKSWPCKWWFGLWGWWAGGGWLGLGVGERWRRRRLLAWALCACGWVCVCGCCPLPRLVYGRWHRHR